jgi:hypothetical protein
MLGYQGWTQFNINLGQSGIATWANNCTNNATNTSCSASPFYTSNYFNSQWITNYEPYNQYFDGYNTSGHLVYAEVCYAYPGTTSWWTQPAFCTLGEQEIYTVTSLWKDAWNINS